MWRNNYPTGFIDKCVAKFKRDINLARDRHAKTKFYFFRFPFIRQLSSRISECFKGTEWRPAFYNLKTVGLLFTKSKDQVPKGKQSELVYKITCECGKSYVGQTKQLLHKRVYQHKHDCKPMNILKPQKTALAKHHFDTGHNFNFNNVEILDMESNYLKKNISEMICNHLEDTINMKSDTNNLSNLYNGSGESSDEPSSSKLNTPEKIEVTSICEDTKQLSLEPNKSGGASSAEKLHQESTDNNIKVPSSDAIKENKVQQNGSEESTSTFLQQNCNSYVEKPTSALDYDHEQNQSNVNGNFGNSSHHTQVDYHYYPPSNQNYNQHQYAGYYNYNHHNYPYNPPYLQYNVGVAYNVSHNAHIPTDVYPPPQYDQNINNNYYDNQSNNNNSNINNDKNNSTYARL
ncbi:GATA zinc finger domain-containing protein 14-like [Microplitis mediator]|uniref:GATA zinc finger domain-containing protein 14-like n=1 Tax=Microplitis mediator TaxID=375433 RepID=UPI0025538C3B|nr:GATA zinc finger domain-containing protein 14-like [Microplitis mediator]